MTKPAATGIRSPLHPNPFGMLTPGRSWEAGSGYRFGFNTQEQDDEIYGHGKTTTAMFWEYDVRLGRRWNIDPIVTQSVSPYSVNLNNCILYNDPNGDDVGYEKLGDRLRVGWNRLTDRNFRNNFNTWKNDNTTMYTFRKRNNNPVLPNAIPGVVRAGGGGGLPGRDVLYSTQGQVGGRISITLTEKQIDFGWKKYVIVSDNNTNNLPTTYTLDRLVPGKAITFNPLDHPDEFTLNDASSNQLYQATQVIPQGNEGAFQNLTGFAPVLDVSGNVRNRQYIVPNGVTTLILTQRSQSPWPYTDLSGNAQTSTKPDSNWSVGYWKYRKYNIKFTMTSLKINL